MPILEFEGGGWMRVHMPEHGRIVMYGDGLCNILDRNGRCLDAHHGVLAYRPGNEFSEAEDKLVREAQMRALEGEGITIV